MVVEVLHNGVFVAPIKLQESFHQVSVHTVPLLSYAPLILEVTPESVDLGVKWGVG